MKLTPVDYKATHRMYEKTKYQALLEEFIQSGVPCARVDGHDCSKAYVAACGINSAIKRLGYHQVRAFSCSGTVYLCLEEEIVGVQ